MKHPTKYIKIYRKLSQVVKNRIGINKDKVCKLLSRTGISWSYLASSTNSIMHALVGNRNIGYKIGAWNCRRALLDSDGSPSAKMTDIELYLQRHQLHLFAIIESDLHGPQSRVSRKNPLTSHEIQEKLQIDGYSILLPQSWYAHHQARLIVFVKDGVQLKERKLDPSDSDLPSMSFEFGLGREKKSCVNFFYREYTGGVSGLVDITSQMDRLERQVSHWKTLHETGRDVVILGDSNLCALQWEGEGYQHRELANKVQDYLLEEASQQLVTDITRSEISGGVVQTSCIDHC